MKERKRKEKKRNLLALVFFSRSHTIDFEWTTEHKVYIVEATTNDPDTKKTLMKTMTKVTKKLSLGYSAAKNLEVNQGRYDFTSV
jgi:hypothetical protein